MSRKKLAFKVSAKAARLIGRENVANAEGAIVELVKNTYDADADHCVILFRNRFPALPEIASPDDYVWLSLHLVDPATFYEPVEGGYRLRSAVDEGERAAADARVARSRDLWIIDNGDGMTADTIEKHWMVIGTNFKEENIFSGDGRVRTGAKGIGRFALDRLGTFCRIHSTALDPTDDVTSLDWQVDWNAFDGAGKVLDDVQASLSSVDQPVKALIQALPSWPAIAAAMTSGRSWNTGTAICISALRDTWAAKDVARLFNSLASLVPPEEQKPLSITVLDEQLPDFYGQVRSETLDDFDYKLVAGVRSDGVIDIRIARNELSVFELPTELFDLPDMAEERYQLEAFRAGEIHYERRFTDWFPSEGDRQIAALKAIGPFEFTLLFYKRAKLAAEDQRKYPYRSFQPGPRKKWLDEQGGIKIYRDDFLVRPYGEPNGRAYDWLSLGQRVALNPAPASRKGWRVSPQSLAGTVRISRARNPGLTDQSNREGVIENESFRLFRQLIVRLVKEFEDDRSHILSNLLELDKRRNPDEEAKSAGAVIARKIDENPRMATAEDAVTLAVAYKVQREEIRDLKTEQGMLRSLATLGTVLVSFSHEIGQLQTSLGSRAKTLEAILTRLIPKGALDGLPDAVNPINTLNEWDASDQKVRQWFDFALTSVRADKRTRKPINMRDHLRQIEATWRPFLASREVAFEVEFEPDFDPSLSGFEIDLDSIFNNLILNSVEAFVSRRHPGRRSIRVVVSGGENGAIDIHYTDTGPGLDPTIPAERRIFNFGETTKTGLNGSPGGTGIGMWILDSIVGEYGGQARAFRPGDGWGFRIDITLPTTPGRTDG